jgi:hypothetical protein
MDMQVSCVKIKNHCQAHAIGRQRDFGADPSVKLSITCQTHSVITLKRFYGSPNFVGGRHA